MYNKVGIIGLGLIGGSLAKAFRARTDVKKIVAMNRNEDVLIIAKQEGVIDEYTTSIDNTFEGCDIIFICTPVDKICWYAEKLVPFIDKNCVITDVGSTKETIYNDIEKLKDNFLFIGGHPMTGSEKFRYQASKEHLFENAYYILTPANNVPEKKVIELKETVEKMGAISVIISPKKHDHIVAAISHVPHVVASSLVNMVKKLDSDDGYMHTLAAGGFKDITRIASSSPEMWQSICIENKTEILSVLDSLQTILNDFKIQLLSDKNDGIYDYFDSARIYRDTFTGSTGSKLMKHFEINVDMQDKPGGIAVISVILSSNKINIKNMNIINNREHEPGVLNIFFESEESRQMAVKLLRGMNYEVFVK